MAQATRSSESDQVKNLREIFNRFDHDSDGRLTQLELAAFLRSLGLKPVGDKLYDLLSNMDTNRSGSIEFHELVDAISSFLTDVGEDTQHPLLDEAQLLEVFRSFDRDSNGFISRTEMAKAMKRMGHPMTYNDLVALMNEADSDGDGMISYTEFATIMGKSAAEFFDLGS